MTERSQTTSRWIVASALIAIILAAAIGMVKTQSNDRSEDLGSDAPPSAVLSEVEQRGNIIGSPSAPATIVEYIDLQCPFCGEASKNLTDTILEDYVQTGKLNWRIELLTFMGKESKLAAQGAWAAAKWNKFGEFVTEFLHNQKKPNSGYVTTEHIGAIFERIGVPRDEALHLTVSPEIVKKAQEATANAKRNNVERTPTFGIETDKFVLMDVREYSPRIFTHEVEAVMNIK